MRELGWESGQYRLERAARRHPNNVAALQDQPTAVVDDAGKDLDFNLRPLSGLVTLYPQA